MEAMDRRVIDPAQADFWNLLGGRVLERVDLEPFGVEHVETPARLRELHTSHPCPTVVDAGQGIFGAAVALLFVDDDTGRAVAYASPVVILRAALGRGCPRAPRRARTSRRHRVGSVDRCAGHHRANATRRSRGAQPRPARP